MNRGNNQQIMKMLLVAALACRSLLMIYIDNGRYPDKYQDDFNHDAHRFNIRSLNTYKYTLYNRLIEKSYIR